MTQHLQDEIERLYKRLDVKSRENRMLLEQMDRIIEQNSARKQKPQANPIAGIRGDELYHNIHVALRKCADSKITSAFYNAMHFINRRTQNWLVDVVEKALENKVFATDKEVVEAVRGEFYDREDVDDNPRQMLSCMLQLFDHNDWLGFLGFVIIWPYELRENKDVLGKMVKANHPITCLNPDEWFEVVNARVEDNGVVYVIGKKTCWFRLDQCEVKEA